MGKTMVQSFLRNNWFDGKKVTLEDMRVEQNSYLDSINEVSNVVMGSGVILDFPQEVVIFDSNSLSSAQQGWVAVNTFDGRGILETPVRATDLDEGNQVSVTISDCRIGGSIKVICTIIGKLFDGTLKYEHLVFTENGTRVTYNHFKEVTNVFFQNLYGNLNTLVDGYGCFNTAGRAVVCFSSSYKVSHDLIAAEQVLEPDIIFRNYKVYDMGSSLQAVLQEAVGSSNDVDDLDINTTVSQFRLFSENQSTEVIYAQKFKMSGNNIQKISLLFSLESGTDWSGSIVVGVRPLLTDVSACAGFIPENDIDFDPNTVPLEEVVIDQNKLQEYGLTLTTEPQQIDFVFSNSQISNPALSKLIDGGYYALTVRRTGSTSTGTIVMQEARNSSDEQRLTVFQGGLWTDVPDSTLWFRVWTDSVKVASGVLLNNGKRLPLKKVELSSAGIYTQVQKNNIQLINTSENTENYLIVDDDLTYSKSIPHPTSGDAIATRVEDSPRFQFLEQSDLLTYLGNYQRTNVLVRAIDNNPRGNPDITGLITHPGLAFGNIIDFINPNSDLLNQNVIGSIITPDTSEPSIRYRIVNQQTFVDLYGDTNGDGILDVFDLARIAELDGYSVYGATTASYTDAEHVSAFMAETITALELIRADIDQTDGYEISSDDLSALNLFITDGTAFPIAESSFVRVRLTLEPLLDGARSYDNNAESTLQIHVDNPNLVDPSLFSFGTGISYEIQPLEVWEDFNVELLDLRRYCATTFLDFETSELSSVPESAGQNNFFIPGDMYLGKTVKTLDGSVHPLDFEVATISLELPEGNTEGEVNIFSRYISGVYKFSDGSFVSNSALANGQVKFAVSISSHVKNVSGNDGYVDFDGYNDGYGENADEAIATYIDSTTGLLRIRAFNVVRNTLFPELRTRIIVQVFLKKAGFANQDTNINSTNLSSVLQQFSPI
jgi:hypothetical protein